MFAAITSAIARAQPVPTTRIGPAPGQRAGVQLQPRVRIGSMSGDADAFGRVAFAALRENREILVADDQAHRISVFTPSGTLKRQVGRQGQGPGEFELPWLVAALAQDSIAVWDAALARVSILSPTLVFVRSFSLPPMWAVNSIRELPDGRFLLSALDVATRKALHIVTRTGKHIASFADVMVPRDLAPYETSLLGGRALVLDSAIAFSHKSPFRIDIFNLKGQLVRRCEGDAKATTAPHTAITRNGSAASLQWKRFVHSTGFLPGASRSEVWNVITDQINGRTSVHGVDIRTCQQLRESTLPLALFLNDARGDDVVGVVESDYPEVIVYSRASRGGRELGRRHGL